MSTIRFLFQLCLVVMILGSLNWGLFALDPENDLIKSFFGTTVFSTLAYIIVFIAGICGSFIWLSYPNDVCM
jgi:uncharacterized membrane protein YuzA (DUF378 family)